MAEVIWTMEAVHCLEEIRKYIAHDNPTAAQNVINGIFAKVQSLKNQIRLGQRYDSMNRCEIREILYLDSATSWREFD